MYVMELFVIFQELFTELKNIEVRKSYDQNIEARRSQFSPFSQCHSFTNF